MILALLVKLPGATGCKVVEYKDGSGNLPRGGAEDGRTFTRGAECEFKCFVEPLKN